MDIICMSNKQVADKYWTKRTGNGQRAENHRRVIRWLYVRNFEHAQISPMDTLDINVHVMDKTDTWTDGYSMFNRLPYIVYSDHADSKVYGANMGPTWGRQDPGGPHVGPIYLAIWVHYSPVTSISYIVTGA